MDKLLDLLKSVANRFGSSRLFRKNRIIRCSACWIVIVTYICWKYLDLLKCIDLPLLPLFPDIIRRRNIVMLIVFWLFIIIIEKLIMRNLILPYDNEYRDKCHKMLFIESVLDFFISVVFLFCALSMLVDFAHNIYPNSHAQFFVSLVYLGYSFIEKEYIKSLFDINVRYTDYFDVNGKRIPIDGEVIYKNRLYYVRKLADGVVKLQNKEMGNICNKWLDIEDAINDGGIVLYLHKKELRNDNR